jgi:hypothetical protein
MPDSTADCRAIQRQSAERGTLNFVFPCIARVRLAILNKQGHSENLGDPSRFFTANALKCSKDLVEIDYRGVARQRMHRTARVAILAGAEARGETTAAGQ